MRSNPSLLYGGFRLCGGDQDTETHEQAAPLPLAGARCMQLHIVSRCMGFERDEVPSQGVQRGSAPRRVVRAEP